MQVATAVSRMRESDMQKPPGIAEAIDWLAALDLLGVDALDEADDRPHARRGAQVRRGPGGDPRGRPRAARAMRVETVWLDLPATVGAFARRLHEAGVPLPPARSADLARALELVRPVARRRLYWTARAVVVTDPSQVPAFDAVFAGVFRGYDARRGTRAARRAGRARAARPCALGGARQARRDRRADGEGERRGAALREALRRARAARARAPLRADVAAAAGDPAAPHAPLREGRGTASASTCGARCAAACAPAATRSGSPAGTAASCAAGSCCCATSRARWSRTRAPTCSS